MANQVAARLHGDDYQALVFWQQACRLLREEDEIESIEIESADAKSLDDVVVYHKDGYSDQDGRLLKRECFQVKYHVDYRESIRAESLIDPAFIKVKRGSFLQNAFDLWKTYRNSGIRLIFCSLWPIDPNDELRKLVSGNDGRMAVEVFRKSGARSASGKIKEMWKKHLKISDEELLLFLESVQIIENVQKTVLVEYVNKDLILAGLLSISSKALVNQYFDLARSLIKGRRSRLTRNELIAICKQSKLWRGPPIHTGAAKKIGVRSRLRGTEGFCEWAEERLDLFDKFDGRMLKGGMDWATDVFAPLNSFLRTRLKPGDHCELWMPVHATIATAIGYTLDSKQGVDVHVRQSTDAGMETWKNAAPDVGNVAICEWTTSDQAMGGGDDIAIAISVTHNILEDVQAYMGEANLKVSVLRHFLCPKCGKLAIANPEEATALVEKLIGSVRQLKRASVTREAARTNVLHVFAAMPNYMAFALGQRLRPLGRVQLYEHNFDSGCGSDYIPSLQIHQNLGE